MYKLIPPTVAVGTYVFDGCCPWAYWQSVFLCMVTYCMALGLLVACLPVFGLIGVDTDAG